MSNRVTKSVIYLVGITGLGFLLVKTVTPSDDEMRKKMGLESEVALRSQQEHSKLTMDRLKEAAGLRIETPLTLAILKPDIVAQPHIVRQIKNLILRHGFYFVRSKHLTLTRDKAEEFYKEHDGKFFHNRLVTFMSSGPVSIHILARENAIAEWRKLMGPTKVLRTIYENPESIRGQFGLTDTRNSTHGSDSPEKAKCEIKFFFPEFDLKVWEDSEAPLFFKQKVKFDSVKGVHSCCGPYIVTQK